VCSHASTLPLCRAAFACGHAPCIKLTRGEVIALEGKVLRHSFDMAPGQSSIQMVSAWAAGARLVLGQVKIMKKT